MTVASGGLSLVLLLYHFSGQLKSIAYDPNDYPIHNMNVFTFQDSK